MTSSQIYFPRNTLAGSYIACLWEFRGGHQYTEYILPQGVIEIVFNLAEPIFGKLPNSSTFAKAPLCFIQGIHTHTLIAHYSGLHHLFGIRIHPYAVRDFLNILSPEINNQAIDATLVRQEFRNLWNQLGEAKTFQDRVLVVLNTLRFDSTPGCPRSARICELFNSGPLEFQSVDQLARKVCYSSRHLNRKSQELFGLSAEELVLYKKFMSSVQLIHRNQSSRLIDIALDSGFYDQSHFNRVFKTFTGLTPREYRLQKENFPFHLFS
jgi:AraC-like DNA-binding protein